MNDFKHTPVLLDEVIDALQVGVSKRYIDATLGGGGHTEKILQAGGLVLGIDQDQEAVDHVKKAKKDKVTSKELILVKGNFRDIGAIARKNSFENVDGILFDLGVSSYQLDSVERGFSLRGEARLDMRMDKGSPLSAYEVINKYPYDHLVEIFYKYGEEHNAKDIAQKIVERRKAGLIETTKELASLIEKVSHKPEGIHPATRIFQAIRIEVNDEINALKIGLDQSIELLNRKGRIVAISFHSLEDRVIKQSFTELKRKNIGAVISKKPITATYEENMKNRRARSAKLRVFEKY